MTMTESETMQHWKSVKSLDNGELALAMADFATKMERERNEARGLAEECRSGMASYPPEIAEFPWERAELEGETSENTEPLTPSPGIAADK